VREFLLGVSVCKHTNVVRAGQGRPYRTDKNAHDHLSWAITIIFSPHLPPSHFSAESHFSEPRSNNIYTNPLQLLVSTLLFFFSVPSSSFFSASTTYQYNKSQKIGFN
jgi:hypothetical protein